MPPSRVPSVCRGRAAYSRSSSRTHHPVLHAISLSQCSSAVLPTTGQNLGPDRYRYRRAADSRSRMPHTWQPPSMPKGLRPPHTNRDSRHNTLATVPPSHRPAVETLSLCLLENANRTLGADQLTSPGAPHLVLRTLDINCLVVEILLDPSHKVCSGTALERHGTEIGDGCDDG